MATLTAVHPGKLSEQASFRSRYDNSIGGKRIEPAPAQYFENVTRFTGKPYCEIPRSNAQGFERALDAVHAAHAARDELEGFPFLIRSRIFPGDESRELRAVGSI